MIRIASILFSLLLAAPMLADSEPYLKFSWTLTDGSGEQADNSKTDYEGSAPITATVEAQVVYTDDEGNEQPYTDATFYGAWRVWSEGGQMEEPELSNPNNPTDFYFRSAGRDSIAFVGYVEITKESGTERIDITPAYNRTNRTIFSVKTYESKLTFPNAFSPNGDGYNEKFIAKESQSIVEFHAAIYNRWGQKLYEWDDVNDGWDGTFHGKQVKDGVYYVQVKARGADGQTFNIKKDVNIIRGFEETYSNTTE